MFTAADFGFAFLRGYSQVIFQENRSRRSYIFCQGVFINSPIAALYGLWRAVPAGYIAFPHLEFQLKISNWGIGKLQFIIVCNCFCRDKTQSRNLGFALRGACIRYQRRNE